MIAEELPDGRRQIQFGHAARLENDPKTRFETATLFAVFSDDGLNGCCVAFQRHLRDRIVSFPTRRARDRSTTTAGKRSISTRTCPTFARSPRSPRTSGRSVSFSTTAGSANATTTRVRCRTGRSTPASIPTAWEPLIAHVQKLGMTFGLWFEPEMINPDSDIHRAHPDWALGGEDQILGRYQMALNMALPEVRDFLFERIGKLLGDHEIEYIKWDHNRVLPMPDAAQTRGSYELIDRLRAAFPDVEIESCASGGGRIDFGILGRTHRIWLSDSNDAVERLEMQHNAAIFLPSVVTGSHVGPRVCHTSGRTIDIRFRAWVAAQRHLGFEMDPRELSAEETTQVLKDVTAWWKANRDWMSRADILRLDSADPAVFAEQHLAEGGGRFAVFAGKAETSRQIAPRPLTLTRLTKDASYRVEVINRGDAPTLSRGEPLLKSGPVTLSGGYLMNHGSDPALELVETMWVVEGRLDGS